MKSYTDIEQSKKLAEILPPESADMYYQYAQPKSDRIRYNPIFGNPIDALEWYNKRYTYFGKNPLTLNEYCIPAWSLEALLDNIPQVKLDSTKQYDKKLWSCCAYFVSNWHDSDWYDNPVDACYEMILKLNELKML